MELITHTHYFLFEVAIGLNKNFLGEAVEGRLQEVEDLEREPLVTQALHS